MFDKLLLDHATESGCRVFQDAHVTDLAFDTDGGDDPHRPQPISREISNRLFRS
jgi:hypothetical protein